MCVYVYLSLYIYIYIYIIAGCCGAYNDNKLNSIAIVNSLTLIMLLIITVM